MAFKDKVKKFFADLGLTKRDIATMASVMAALVLVVFVFAKIYTSDDPSDSQATNTSVIYMSQTREDGQIEFYTMIEEYVNGGFYASVTYTTTTTTTKPTSEESTTEEEPVTSVVNVTDANGETVTDAEGKPVTEIVTVTTTSTTEPATSHVPVTDANGVPVTDAQGKPVTEVVTVPPTTETTTEDIWTTESTTSGRFDVDIIPEYSNESGTAATIVNQINKTREQAGLPALRMDSMLSASARTYCLSLAIPESFGSASAPAGSYSTQSTSGGAQLYSSILANTAAATGENLSSIGVGVIKYKGTYYATVVLA